MIRSIIVCAVIACVASPAFAVDVSSIQWETNDSDPYIGDPDNAIRGGTFYTSLSAYPLTLRLMGPNSSDVWANWGHAYTEEFKLVRRHPQTDNWIPWMATHWFVAEDNRTAYYKLDPDARWSDGKPITADDYVFCWEMHLSKYVVSPYHNKHAEDMWELIEAIDDYTLKIVGRVPSWRPLQDLNIFAMPRHAIVLDENYVQAYNTVVVPVQGPYTVGERSPGQSIVLDRQQDWWGDDKRYMKGLYNVDHIHCKIIAESDRAFDFFKKGELSYYRVNTAKTWAEEMDFEAIEQGWVHQKRLFVEWPEGLYGLAMNLEKPLFRNKDFRKAIQYMFKFDDINNKLMYGAYYRQVSTFTGSEYGNPEIRPYGFDPRKAREHLTKAGFAKRGSDGILVDASGQRASFSLTYGSKGLERHFTVVKQVYKKLGVEIELRLLEPGTAFRNGLERQFEAAIVSQTTNFYPDPYLYFHSDHVSSKNNNNIFAFGNERADELIDVYRFSLDKDERIAAMHELDLLIQDEAFYVPFWHAPFLRFVYWDNVKFPSYFYPRRTGTMMNWQTYWIDPGAEERLADAQKQKKSLGKDVVVDTDPYQVKERIEASLSAAATGSD